MSMVLVTKWYVSVLVFFQPPTATISTRQREGIHAMTPVLFSGILTLCLLHTWAFYPFLLNELIICDLTLKTFASLFRF